ncbi:hypothetical protein ACFY3U_05955 [Micromonospora sp. NPDC000089]|uniref:hypothetical protein n=1 Tax=unclassified Micromonospora TaxID=2617518 RepID=UPI0036C598BC
MSDFATEWEDVRFASRVWERQVDDGYRVDLRVHVLRGDRLANLDELRDFLAEYHERDPRGWALEQYQPNGSAGLIGDGQAFWLVESGVAVDVVTDPRAIPEAELRALADQIRPI